LATLAGFHDLGVAKLVWPGLGTYMQPFGSLLVFAAFGFALGRRVLEALAAVENINTDLQVGIIAATQKLVASEQALRKLEVESAIEGERERLMREIHDGIGSSLITALAVAESQRAPASTIDTLKRSITDLRLAVDSLEPIDGDVVMLLASFRCRVERDLRDAGLVFVWKVDACPPLPWLDAIGALHILRILQETVGNVLLHAHAERITVYCREIARGSEAGVEIVITDDGGGFDPVNYVSGRGLANMHARIEALGAKFSCRSAAGSGTTTSIWLPANIDPPLTMQHSGETA
jgi:signal transduction histidine kinase